MGKVEDLIESLSNIPASDWEGRFQVLLDIIALQAKEIAELKQIAEEGPEWILESVE